MKIIRWDLGKLILFLDFIFSPKQRVRSDSERKELMARLGGHEIYQFEACPFCVKVRRFLKSEGLSLPYRDATRDPYRGELLEKGGKIQVPCLKISQVGGDARWLYESNDIIAYLKTKIY